MTDPRISRGKPRKESKSLAWLQGSGRGRTLVLGTILVATALAMTAASFIFQRSRSETAQIRVMRQGLDLLRLEREVGFMAGEAEIATLWWMFAGDDEAAFEQAQEGFAAEIDFVQRELAAFEPEEAWVPVVARLQEVAAGAEEYLSEPRKPAELRGWYEEFPQEFAGIFPSDPGGRWSNLLDATIGAQYAIYSAINYAELALSRYAFSNDAEPFDPTLVNLFTSNAGNLEQMGMSNPEDFSPFEEDLDLRRASEADERISEIVSRMRTHDGVRTIEGDLDYLVGRSRVTWFDEPSAPIEFTRSLARDLNQDAEAALSRTESILSLAVVANGRRAKTALAAGLMSFGLGTLLLVSLWRGRQKEEDRLRNVAETDALTGIYNRFALFAREQERLRNPKRAPFALLHMDLDHFKEINDRYGHATGDQALIAFANVCRTVVRHPQDTLARIGGDEFVLVLHGLKEPQKEAEEVAERIMQLLEEPAQLAGHELFLRTSVGIAVAHQPVELDALLHEADIALLEAKKVKRSRHTVFERNLHGNLIHEVEDALASGQVRPLFQPILRATNQRLAGFEVLARWEREDGSIVPSASFIRVLQSLGGSSLWLRQVFAGIHDVIEHVGAEQGRFWINVTLADLVAHKGESIRELVEASGISPDRIGIEVTERICRADLKEARAALQDLRDLGLEIALDDLGSDGVPLRHLLDLPLDRVKIDGGLIRGLEHSDSVRHLIQGLLAIAVHLDLKIVAEQIETRREQEVLLQLGVTYLQGNLFGEPVRTEDVPDLVASLRPSSLHGVA